MFIGETTIGNKYYFEKTLSEGFIGMLKRRDRVGNVVYVFMNPYVVDEYSQKGFIQFGPDRLALKVNRIGSNKEYTFTLLPEPMSDFPKGGDSFAK